MGTDCGTAVERRPDDLMVSGLNPPSTFFFPFKLSFKINLASQGSASLLMNWKPSLIINIELEKVQLNIESKKQTHFFEMESESHLSLKLLSSKI